MITLPSIDGKETVEGRRIFNKDGTLTPYIVTEDGQIYSEEIDAYRILDKPNEKSGYIMISLAIDNEWKKYLIHRLVADHFLTNEYQFPCVNHKDCNKLNNHYSNLEHCTYSYNSRYDVIYGKRYEKLPHYKQVLSVDQIKTICSMIERGYKNQKIADILGIDKYHITNIKGRYCHQEISKDYDFGDHYQYYGDNMIGNEGNHYIPPLENEPVYIKKDSLENIEKMCEMLSGEEFIGNNIVAARFSVSPKFIKKLRYGEIFTEISQKYNINNDKSTRPRMVHGITDEATIRHIFELLSTGDHTVRSVSVITGIDIKQINKLLNDDYYNPIKNEYKLNIKETRKGKPLTKEEINEVINLLEEGIYTRQMIADKVGLSLASIVKIKRAWKKGKL